LIKVTLQLLVFDQFIKMFVFIKIGIFKTWVSKQQKLHNDS